MKNTKKYLEYEPKLSELTPLFNDDGDDDLIATALSKRLRKYGKTGLGVMLCVLSVYCLTDDPSSLRQRLMRMVRRRTDDYDVICDAKIILKANITERRGRGLSDIPLYVGGEKVEGTKHTLDIVQSDWQTVIDSADGYQLC